MPKRDGTAIDHTGELRRLGFYRLEDNKDSIRRAMQTMKNPGKHVCPKCGGERFYILADQATNALSLICANDRCGAFTLPIQIMVQQLDDAEKAKAAGIWTPSDRGPTRPLVLDLDVERG